MAECFHPKTIRLPDGSPQVVRCQKCLACLQHRQAEWITRLSQEFKVAPEGCYFVTLTYDDEHVPLKEVSPGEFLPAISSADVCKFHMDLRKRFQQGFYLDDTLVRAGWKSSPEMLSLPPDVHFRYYVTSEYGSQTHRPHLHGFYSRLPDDDALVFDLFQHIWGKGFITCEKASTEACAAYVSKYLVNESLVPVDKRLPKPRAWMSKGLGSSYLDNTTLVEWHREAPAERQFVPVNGKRGTLPRYLRDRIFDDEMRAVILDGCVKRDEVAERRFLSLSPYEQLRQGLAKKHKEEELVAQAEWRFRKNGKIK